MLIIFLIIYELGNDIPKLQANRKMLLPIIYIFVIVLIYTTVIKFLTI